MHKLEHTEENPRKITQCVLQATQMLGMYNAELARFLHLTCADGGELASARRCLIPHTKSWEQAELLIRLYNQLYVKFSGNEVAIYHC